MVSDGNDYYDVSYSKKEISAGSYEQCSFDNCICTEGGLSGISFTDCTFNNCDLSLSKLKNTTFNDVRFYNCKLLGLHFSDCNQFLLSMNFEKCLLSVAVFYRVKLKGTKFIDCSLKEVDFTDADLTGATLKNCDCSNAVFDNTILDKADFRSAIDYSLDPERNRIKKTRFSLPGVIGLLDKYNIVID